MTQYLLSVWHDGEFDLPDPEVMQKVFAQVDAFNAEVQAAGAWVFAGGLHPRSSATTVRVKDGEVFDDRRPVRRDRRNRSAGSGSSRPRTSTPRSTGRARARPPARGPVEVRPFQG